MSNYKIKILSIGDCNILNAKIKSSLSSIMNVEIIEVLYSKYIEYINNCRDFSAIYICCTNEEIDIKKIIYSYHITYPHIPIIGVMPQDISKQSISEFYEDGITDHIYPPRNQFEQQILICLCCGSNL